MKCWVITMIIINIIALILSVLIINRGITNSCNHDVILGLVLLFVNLICLGINIYRKENDIQYMAILDVILGVIVFAVFIIFIWELTKAMLFEKLFNKTSIKDVKEHIDDALHETMFYKYDIMFRTPDCKAYNKFNVHVANKDDKEVIMIDLN